MNKQTKFILIFIGILLVAGIVLYFGVLQTQFVAPLGFKPVGESGAIITGLSKISTGIYTSTNWDIESSQDQILGDDFYLKSETNGGNNLKFTSKNTYGKGREFRTITHVEGGFNNNAQYDTHYQVRLVTPTQTINVHNLDEVIGSSKTYLLETKSSLFTGIVRIYWGGQLVSTITTSEDFKIQIAMQVAGSSDVIRIGIENSAYKDVFNCQVDVDEQYYYAVFKRPDTSTVSKSQLENFHKWCPDFPVEVWTNSGAIPDETIAPALEGELGNPPQTFTLPTGQIWGVTYIGEKKSLTTPCELNELLVNGDTCTAKTVLEIDLICEVGGNCPGGGPQIDGNISNISDSLIIETEAVDYVLSNLQTHQFLADNLKIRFTHFADDFSFSPSSFNLFGKTFASDGVTSLFGITPQTASFSYGTNIGDIAIGDIQQLDQFNKVALTRVELQDPADVGIGNTQKFLAEWTFDIDTSFLVLSYDEQTKEIIVTNNYYPVSGGISLIKENNLGQQTSQDVQKSYPLGTTKVSIGDTTGLVKIGGRPYFNLETPDYNYKISASNAITISDLEEDQIIVNIADEPATPSIQLENIQGGDNAIISKPKTKISAGTIAGIVGGLIIGVSIFLIIRGLRRPRIKRRR